MPTLPNIAPNGQRVSRSTLVNNQVAQTPVALLAQAHAFVPSLTLDQYALARVVASELGNGALAEQAAIADADANRARLRGKTMFAHVTGTVGMFGRQGYGGRLVATSQDPTVAHCQLAQAVLSGTARGYAAGAHVYFDPVSQWALHRDGRNALHPLVVLEKWTFNKPATNTRMVAGRYTADLGPAASSGRVDWVGPIAGVRPSRLMLFRASATETNYQAARRIVAAVVGLDIPGGAAIVGLAAFAFGVLT